jgi:2-phosphosulfolactate phosphatase
MLIDVAFTPDEIPDDSILEQSAVVVIDVLRASTTLCMMLEHGARTVFVCSDVSQARALVADRSGSDCLLAGEVGGFKPDGFDLGNSPLDITPDIVAGKQIFFSTSNGTRMLNRTKASPHRFVSTFVNLTASINVIGPTSQRSKFPRLLLCCSGNHGQLSLEDSFFAGTFVSRYIASGNKAELTDAAKAATCIANSYSNNIRQLIIDAAHAQYLCMHGFDQDVEFCLRSDQCLSVPICRGQIVDRMESV